MKDSYIDTIINSLLKSGGQLKGDSIWLQCCFHEGDSTPSLSVNIFGSKVSTGTYHCFGCGASGSYSKLSAVRKLGLPKIDSRLLQSDHSAKVVTLHPSFSDTCVETYLRTFGITVFTKWIDPNSTNIPMFFEWYGIPGQLVHCLEGYLVKERNEEQRLFFPVRVRDIVRGGFRVIQEKEAGKKTYLNCPGTWTSDYGLFPYDYVVKRIKKYDISFVVLVEGPRDALRLIDNGIPALAVLGSQSFSTTKAGLLTGIRGIDTVFVANDTDDAGEKMVELVYKILHNDLDVRKITLPSNGEKVDPQSVCQSFINKLRNKLAEYCPGFKKSLTGDIL